jgi:hypothetical protein
MPQFSTRIPTLATKDVTEECLDMSRLVVAKQKAHRQTDRQTDR